MYLNVFFLHILACEDDCFARKTKENVSRMSSSFCAFWHERTIVLCEKQKKKERFDFSREAKRERCGWRGAWGRLGDSSGLRKLHTWPQRHRHPRSRLSALSCSAPADIIHHQWRSFPSMILRGSQLKDIWPIMLLIRTEITEDSNLPIPSFYSGSMDSARSTVLHRWS